MTHITTGHEIVEDTDEILAAARRLESQGDDDATIDPTHVSRPDNPMTRLEDAVAASHRADVALFEAVQSAAAAGASWAAIGAVLGVSRQAVRQRFGPLIKTK
ncbi:hypothetical protein SAMN06264364_10222 [Quadrisphaera granulorum]|uniref:Homeodomain-like domain-containing protein n=1 Tax=Quadrisphaera granulorum TaxID=317664 RepID=A0A316AFA4_9ACTN|nr:hypothetical protein [Quadrisphaera granulorum]PWJ55660.1 hypothetical protein BXY45_10222 [Quadrisphaera granulorum]SZE95157.1 hypothetical protein SAMN06264364_10222 [Quadrisphaera granulorum]